MTTCGEIMTPDPECCDPSTQVKEVAQLMKRKNIGPVPVINNFDDRLLVGIVTDRDLALNVLAEGCDYTVPVSQAMTKNPASCRPTDKVDMAVEIMEKLQVRRIPVVNEEGKLVGIIAQGDIALRLPKKEVIAQVVEEISKPAELVK